MQIDPMYFLIFTIVTFVSFVIVSYFANLYFKRNEQIEENAKEIVNTYLSFLSEKLKLHQNSVIKYIKSRTEFLEKFKNLKKIFLKILKKCRVVKKIYKMILKI